LSSLSFVGESVIRRGITMNHKIHFFLLSLTTLILLARPAHADNVDVLINTLKTADNYKVRVTAAMLLSKHKGEAKAFAALLYTLNNDENETVQGTAALSLGKLGNKEAIPDLEKASKSKKTFLKDNAKKALEMLADTCPEIDLKGKQIYLNIGPLDLTGSTSDKNEILTALRDLLNAQGSEVTYVTTMFPGCKQPSESDLKKKKLKGFMIDGTLEISLDSGEVVCDLKLIVATFPGKSIKMMNSANAGVTGKLTPATIKTCIKHATPAAFAGVKQFLARSL